MSPERFREEGEGHCVDGPKTENAWEQQWRVRSAVSKSFACYQFATVLVCVLKYSNLSKNTTVFCFTVCFYLYLSISRSSVPSQLRGQPDNALLLGTDWRLF